MAGSMGFQAPLTLAVLLLLLLLPSGRLQAQEPAAEAPGAAEAAEAGAPVVIQPTRQSIYQHLTSELQAALGAEEHIRGVYAGVAEGMRLSVRESVMPSLQALVDSVVERAEDAWVAADEAGRTLQVKACVDGAEGDAQQVAKRALEKVGSCVQGVEEEAQRRVREAERLLNEIEDVSKRFVTALETCVKEEEAKEAAQPPVDPAPAADTEVAVTEAEAPPASCPKAEAAEAEAQEAAAPGEKVAPCAKAKSPAPEDPTAAAEEDSTAPDGVKGTKPKHKGCTGCKNKKTPEGASAQEETRGDDLAQGEETRAEKTDNKQPSDEQAEKYGKDQKGKKGKEWKDSKGKDKSGKWKKDNANVDELVEGKASTKSKDGGKDKGKNKKGRESEVGKEGAKMTDKVAEPTENSNPEESSGERKDKSKVGGKDKGKHKKGRETEAGKEEGAENKAKDAEPTANSNPEESSGEKKDKKSKKSDKKENKGKKEKGGESGEGKKGRKKRDLMAVNEEPDQDSAAPATPVSEAQETGPAAAPAASDPWPSEGSTPEERRVIACMRSLAMKPLIDQKTRAYQRLQAVLQRTAAKQQDAPACVTDHVRKAELKISAIKQRMASCADRKMRQEL